MKCFFEGIENQKFDIVIQAGQSNAEGSGRGSLSNPYDVSPDVLYYSSGVTVEPYVMASGKDNILVDYPNEDYIEIAKEREFDGKLSDFALSFAREYVKSGKLEDGRKLLIIRAGVGGTGFAKGFWQPGGVCYTKMIEMIKSMKALNAENHFVALLWHQGEHDAFENAEWTKVLRKKEYYKNFSALISAVRTWTGRPDLPIIAAEFCRDWAEKNIEVCQPIFDATELALKEAGYSSYVQTEGLLSNIQAGASVADDIHFCRQSLCELGQRYFEAYLQIGLAKKI